MDARVVNCKRGFLKFFLKNEWLDYNEYRKYRIAPKIANYHVIDAEDNL